jgi:cytochrome c oxidase subunit 1
VLALFAVLVLLGLAMRASQANALSLGANHFYAIMTFHGLGMAGALLVSALAGVWYLVSK